MMRLHDLVFRYPNYQALNGVSLNVEAGAIVALVGPNGAGKTTLMRCAVGLEEPFSGHASLLGIRVSESPRQVHRHVGYLSDTFGFYEKLSVNQSLKFAASIRKVPPNKIGEAIDKVLEQLDLKPFKNQRVSHLSRGWRQRVGIAIALVHQPKLLILDEPASGLDPTARLDLSKLFLSLRDSGMTLMVSSHILSELEDYCTEMVMLEQGNIIDHHRATERADKFQCLEIALVTPSENAGDILRAFEHVKHVELVGDKWHCQLQSSATQANALLRHLLDSGLPIRAFHPREEKLKDIYQTKMQEQQAAQGGQRR